MTAKQSFNGNELELVWRRKLEAGGEQMLAAHIFEKVPAPEDVV